VPAFYVPANTAVTIGVLSPNAADVDVDVTAQLALQDRTVQLAAAGLDLIPTTAPAGPAANFREMLVQTWRRFFAKATMTGGQLKTYADDGATVVTTQVLNDDQTTQTQGAAS
jgi:hypothetical protein